MGEGEHDKVGSGVRITRSRQLFQQTFIGHLLCAGHSSRHWGYSQWTKDKNPCPQGAYRLEVVCEQENTA